MPHAAHAERLKLLWQLATRRDLDEESRFHAMLRMACESLGMELSVLGAINGEYTARYAHDTLGALPEGTVIPKGDAICRQVLLAREPVFIDDLAAHPEFSGHRLVVEAGLRAYAGVPVWAGEEVEGVLSFLRRQPMPEPWSEVDIAYMELVSGWLGYHLAQTRQQQALERHALSDGLTGLLNRRAAEVRLDEELARARRHNEGYALALLDLDHFKSVNDRYGHAVGDEVLKVVARRIEAGLREDDWVARWGGEEFLVFLRNADMREAVFVLERLAAQVKATPVSTGAGAVQLTLSAGIGLPTNEDRSFHHAVEIADTCLYRAKANGRDRVEAQDGGGVLWPAQIIKRALRDERVVMATQPIVDLSTGVVVADEALARVRLPDGRLLPAVDFIEAAEGLGLMPEIDRIVCGAAMSRCAGKLEGGTISPDFIHFVNLSPQFLARRDLVEEMLAGAMSYCQTCGVEFGPIKPVVFEITERQFLRNLDTLEADLKPLLDFGFRLALDDFGSGYSSFLYLARLPISFLKIEGWMIANMRRERKIRAIVESLARFARQEGIITVAECIEDAETAHILREMGVDLGQGWHFGRPEVETPRS
ncbi:MAG: bifunctional diguanylate cyclase/phosphodiesterase [Pseudomonadota bacterium]|nr:bifunctional diguanylate cyclase/phosphodiesterase [Pseudomonadota bacterium]MDP1902952.1 bifunctional diguanylate cyclase/phosphodiesterase [Pseudomonadota bacterium]MDP2352937.1 bifunctional diguanylate cyclase/phosphodiesterase [Pseudomonadota bacterium]